MAINGKSKLSRHSWQWSPDKNSLWPEFSTFPKSFKSWQHSLTKDFSPNMSCCFSLYQLSLKCPVQSIFQELTFWKESAGIKNSKNWSYSNVAKIKKVILNLEVLKLIQCYTSRLSSPQNLFGQISVWIYLNMLITLKMDMLLL